MNACFDEPEARRRFEVASFRDALRRLRPRRARGSNAEGGSTGDDDDNTPPPDAPAETSVSHT